ncbi:unnamed protein product [Symbiodinium natans]|uniref:Uncharacterized protein n=1 Tax=Symbiodinium natans TaxID=878477 RepID=A0A812P6B3_9DINO|nr:unnamed protein product [Symbiodinium natans]
MKIFDLGLLAKLRVSHGMWAVLRGHVSVARQLLDNKASIACKDSLGATPLTIAVQHRCLDSVKALGILGRFGAGANVNSTEDCAS